MQDATAGSQDSHTAGYSLQEAAVLLGIGVNTLRRRIAAGQVRAEQVERPQGHIWRVYLDIEPPSHDPPIQDAGQHAKQEAVGGSQQPPTQLAQAEAISTLVQTTVAAVMGPLVAEVAASRQTIERQAGEIADLREDRGRLTAENTALNNALEARTAAQNAKALSELFPSRLRAQAPWLLVVLAMIAAILLVWPR